MLSGALGEEELALGRMVLVFVRKRKRAGFREPAAGATRADIGIGARQRRRRRRRGGGRGGVADMVKGGVL
jgi:hypothetical protein